MGDIAQAIHGAAGETGRVSDTILSLCRDATSVGTTARALLAASGESTDQIGRLDQDITRLTRAVATI